jgi:hypothetical protein
MALALLLALAFLLASGTAVYAALNQRQLDVP